MRKQSENPWWWSGECLDWPRFFLAWDDRAYPLIHVPAAYKPICH